MEWEPILTSPTELKILGNGQQFVLQMILVKKLVLQTAMTVDTALRCTLQLQTTLQKLMRLVMIFAHGLLVFGAQKLQLHLNPKSYSDEIIL